VSVLSLAIHPDNPEPRKIRHAIEVLDAGGVAFYPTDTIYALGCALDAKKSVERLYRLKRMNEKQPLALICADLSELSRYAIVTDFAYRMMRRILPGPYTVVLEATREVPRLLLDRRRTIGIRIPASPICEALVRALGRPLLTTSAIPPGADVACLDVDEAKAAWPSGIDLLVDGGPTPGEPSTVVSMIGDEIEVIREGLGRVDGVLV
jgi:tRNA threonylcarbamoyl adenosine modification protein (Sua5/YciO/YrdC/YwlC family)